MASEITGVRKLGSDGKMDLFEYRDMYNDVKTVSFPVFWSMTEEEVEEYLLPDEDPDDWE